MRARTLLTWRIWEINSCAAPCVGAFRRFYAFVDATAVLQFDPEAAKSYSRGGRESVCVCVRARDCMCVYAPSVPRLSAGDADVFI